jgi:hypothetical protein
MGSWSAMTMVILVHFFFISFIVWFLLVTYRTFFKGYGMQLYEKSKTSWIHYSPIASLGKRAFIIFYKIQVIVGLLMVIGLYAALIFYQFQGKINW